MPEQDLRDWVRQHAEEASVLAHRAAEAIDEGPPGKAQALAIVAQAHALAAEALTTAYHFGEQDIF